MPELNPAALLIQINIIYPSLRQFMLILITKHQVPALRICIKLTAQDCNLISQQPLLHSLGCQRLQGLPNPANPTVQSLPPSVPVGSGTTSVLPDGFPVSSALTASKGDLWLSGSSSYPINEPFN